MSKEKMPLSEIRRILERGEWWDNVRDVSPDEPCPWLDELNGAIEAALDKLTEYETAEADGLIVRLPCKVGDTVYDVDSLLDSESNIVSGKVVRISCHVPEEWPNQNEVTVDFGGNIVGMDFSFFGDGVYLTSAEAEAALKEREARHGRTTDETQC